MQRELTAAQLGTLVTGRERSLFADDCAALEPQIGAAIGGARVLVIGGAGSIGSATTRLLARYPTAALHIVDINENSMVELIRDLRGARELPQSRDLRFLPLDFGSGIFARMLAETQPYDFVLNFAAVKHVRSEKDTYTVMHMLDTNVAKQARLLEWLHATGGRNRYFAVSTDKAANPVNFMGASKRLMEHVIFSTALHASARITTSARFANVAFSDGSLLQGWQQRLAKGQPLAVPVDTRRFFVSLEESGQICLIASLTLADAQIGIPKLDERHDLKTLEQIARDFLVASGFDPVPYDDGAEAIARVAADRQRGRYPLLLTALDTAGEKPYEEFVGVDERAMDLGLRALRAIPYGRAPTESALRDLLDRLRQLFDGGNETVDKTVLEALVASAVPEFAHVANAAKLDDRL